MGRVRGWLRKLYGGWATRSLAIGALCSGLDLALGTTLVTVLHAPTRVGAMSGLALGSTLNFTLNRWLAFHQRGPGLFGQVVRWAMVTAVQIGLHGQLTHVLRDSAHVPYVPAKLAADLLIFTFLQLLLLRYVVFPRRAPAP